MEQRPLADRVAAVSALNGPIRRALFDHVSRSGSPVSRDEAANALGLTRSTAAFHLDHLAGEGLLAVQYKRLTGRTGPGSGRPSKLYTRAAGEVSVTVPERRYDVAAQILVAAIEASTRNGQAVAEALLQTARDAGRALGGEGGSLETVLEDEGFEPRYDGNGTIVLGNCPFHRLAQQHPETVCQLNLELLRGVAEGSNGRVHTVLLDPAVGRCCVKAVPRRLPQAGTPGTPNSPT